VEVLSDISDAAGESIHDTWLYPNTPKPSYSLKNWPQQNDPGKEAWKIWRKFISDAFTTQGGKLRLALGHWTRRNKYRVHVSYCNNDATKLYTKTKNGSWTEHHRRYAGRRCIIFHKESNDIDELPLQITPINITSQTEENIITGRWSCHQSEQTQETTCNGLQDYI
jgi:hypothetical protein